MSRFKKVVICGGRDFNNYELLEEKCNEILKGFFVEVVSGCAKGADSLGVRYAEKKKVKVVEFPANWEKYGRSAGPERNKKMAKYADMVIAFWDGKSKGTKSMISLAKKSRLIVHVVRV